MIYFDNAATTKPSKIALDVFNDINKENYFNISAGYSVAFDLFKKNESAKQDIIEMLDGNGTLIFTSGATEANNLAVLGSNFNKNKRYLFSIGEHPSVYNCALELKSKGYKVEFIPLQKNGEIDYVKFEKLLDDQVCFVSTMLVNNEIGAVNNLKKIRELIDSKTKDCTFHVDAVQGFCKVNFSCTECNINLCSISAHKISGVKGVGALYISNNTKLKNINFGGGQENGLRSGTVNVASNISFCEVAKSKFKLMQKNYKKVLELKQYLLEQIKKLKLADIIIVSGEEAKSPYIVSIIIKGNRGETIMRYLSTEKIFIGTGSACSSSKAGNRVLESMGYTKNEVVGAIRISFSEDNTCAEIDEFIKSLTNCLKRMSV